MKSNWPTFDVLKQKSRNSKYLVVIPVINEGSRLHKLLERMKTLGVGRDYDILIADGGSNDGSIDLVKFEELQVRHILVKQGPGKLGAQLQGAYKFALDLGYEGVITLDGNDKDRPEAIPLIASKLDAGIDFVQGSRFVKGGHQSRTPLFRLVAIRLIHAPLLSISSGFHWTDTTQGFRGYSRKLLTCPKLDLFRPILDDYKLLFYISHRAPRIGLKAIEVPTTRVYPSNVAVPTKIKGLTANLEVLKSLVKVAFGVYDQ